MTRTSKWVGTVVVLLGVESSHAQQDIHSLVEWEVWRHVTNAVEEGWLSQSGAQAVFQHIQEEGWPVCREEARHIQGLSELECAKLMQSETWNAWVQAIPRCSSAAPVKAPSNCA